MSNKKINIAVISGGLSNEREVSLKSGEQIYNNLSDEKYDKFLIEISREGKWLLKNDNLKLNPQKFSEKALTIMDKEQGIAKNDLRKFDLIFLGLHGKYGEDGRIQSLLDILGIPYVGSGVLASALGMNKSKALIFLEKFGIKTPKFLLLKKNDKDDIDKIDKRIKESIKYPCVIKPNESGSSIGVAIANSILDLEKAIENAFKEDNLLIVEEYIRGREITCGVLGNSDDGAFELLPPIEIITENEFFDYEAKYFSEKTMEICPAPISDELTEKVQDLAKRVHYIFGCDGLTRSDFILSNDDFYFLEINTLPGMTEQSLCPKQAKAAGMNFSEFLDKQVNLAIKKRGKR